MLLCLSILIASVSQPAPEIELAADRAVLLLRAGGTSLVRYEYSAHLSAGQQEIAWRPEIAGLRREEARLIVSPAEAADVGGAVTEPTRIRWSLAVSLPSDARLSISVPWDDLNWSVQAQGLLEDGHLVWRPYITLQQKGATTAAFHDVVFEAVPAGEQPISLGPLVLHPNKRLQMALHKEYRMKAEEALRYEAGWGEVRRVVLLDPAQATATLGRWKIEQILIIRDPAPPLLAPLSFPAGRGAELRLGPSSAVAVQRTLLDERRENLDFDRFGRVQGWDTVEEILLQVANASEYPVTLEVVEDLPSTWEIKANFSLDTSWTDRAIIRVPVEAGQQAERRYLIIKHSGTRIPK